MNNKPALFLGIGLAVASFISMFIPLWVVYTYNDSFAFSVFTIPGSGEYFNSEFQFLPGLFVFFIIVTFIFIIISVVGAIMTYNDSDSGKVLATVGGIGLAVLFFIYMVIGFVASGTYDAAVGWGEFPFMIVLGLAIPFILMSHSNSYGYSRRRYSVASSSRGQSYPSVSRRVYSSAGYSNGQIVYNTIAVSSPEGEQVPKMSSGVVLSRNKDNNVDMYSVRFYTQSGKKVECSVPSTLLTSQKESTSSSISSSSSSYNETINPNRKVFSSVAGAQRTLDVYPDRVVLTQVQNFRAYLTNNFFNGAKEIPFSSMTSIQFKPASAMILGYIQFEVPGIHSANNFNSENSWTFYDKDNALARRICDYCRKRIMEVRTPTQPAATTIINKQETSAADEIMKFKKLLDAGAITEEEYNAKKKELLSK